MAEDKASDQQGASNGEPSPAEPDTGRTQAATADPSAEPAPPDKPATGSGTLRVYAFTYAPADRPLGGVDVTLTGSDGRKHSGTTRPEDGAWSFEVAVGEYTVACTAPPGFRQGHRHLAFRDPDGPSVRVRATDRIPVLENQVSHVAIGFFPASTGTTGTRDGNGARALVQELSTFPVLTEEVDIRPSGRGGAGGPRSASQVVGGALTDALGWRPRPADPRGFIAALTQSFTCEEVQGHTECHWTPRSTAVQVQADLGAITGAQASIHSRARTAVDAALPLLDALVPLDPAFDPQDVEATRSIVRSSLTALVAELGTEGGPRVSRVDELFLLLLATTKAGSATLTSDNVGGQLGLLRTRFGLESQRVNTIEEEQDFTNFIVLFDWIHDLFDGWESVKQQFSGTSTSPFLGTQLVLISRQLAVIGESVSEVEFALDSVFIGAAERTTLRLGYHLDPDDPFVDKDGQPLRPFEDTSLLVSELLDWISSFASDEGPRLVQDAGKDGVIAFTPVLDRLRKLVRGSLLEGNGGLQDPGDLPAGFRTARVQNALSELADQLDEVHKLARVITRTSSTTLK